VPPRDFTSKKEEQNKQAKLSINSNLANQKRNFKGVWIDDYIYFCSDLSWPEKLLWIEINYLDEEGKYGCRAGNDYFADFLQVSPVSITRYISHLKEFGLIQELPFNGRSRVLKTNKGPFMELESSLVKLTSQPCQIDEGINNKDKNIRYRSIEFKNSISGPSRPDEKPQSKKSSSKDYILPKTGEYAVVLSWNKLPKPAGQHVKFNTKTMRMVRRYLIMMRNGLFGKSDRLHQWDKQWLKTNKIPMKEFGDKKWSFCEVCQTIEGPLASMYSNGYFPENKKTLPTDLATALFNPHLGGSFFIQAFYNPPKLAKDKMVIIKDLYPTITEMLKKEGLLQQGQMRKGDWEQYFKGVEGLGRYLEKVDWSNYGARQLFPEKGLYSLVVGYVRWVKGKMPDLTSPSSIPKRLDIGVIRPGFWMWQKFMEAVNRYWGRVFLCVPAEEK